MAARRALTGAVVALAVLSGGCASIGDGDVHPDLRAAAAREDPLAVGDALEGLIAVGADTPADREFAYAAVSRSDADTAEASFARAAVTGRLVQQRGLLGADLVPDVEREAIRSRELDPGFRDGAATRLLGTLWVIAPAAFLAQGDSERGLALLEGLVDQHPEAPENHLRLAEAYVTLQEPESAYPELCIAWSGRAKLRPDDQRLLEELVRSVGGAPCGS